MLRDLSLVFLLAATAGSPVAWSAQYYCRESATPAPRHESPILRVASLNIAHGRGSSINQMLVRRSRIEENLDRVGNGLRQSGAQVVALQELDMDSRWSGGFDHAARLLSVSGLKCAALAMHAQSWLYRFGTGLMAEATLTGARARTFEPTPPSTTKGLVGATLDWDFGADVRPVRLISVHLDFSRKAVRERQLAEIITAISESRVPIVVMGDFNEDWFADDSVVRRLVEEAGMIAYEPRSEALTTYGSKRLDWILVSREIEFVSYEVLEDELSDHRLVIADLRWRKGS